jgi:predicted metal-dependent hydrolase
MPETIRIGNIVIELTRKDIKHVHLSVHPPSGRVTLIAPRKTRSEVARAYAVSNLAWIRNQQLKMREQARETPRRFVERESHYLSGRRYLLSVIERDANPGLTHGHSESSSLCAPRQSRGEARRCAESVVSFTASRGRSPADPEMGGKARRHSRGLLAPANENQVGRVQPSC